MKIKTKVWIVIGDVLAVYFSEHNEIILYNQNEKYSFNFRGKGYLRLRTR